MVVLTVWCERMYTREYLLVMTSVILLFNQWVFVDPCASYETAQGPPRHIPLCAHLYYHLCKLLFVQQFPINLAVLKQDVEASSVSYAIVRLSHMVVHVRICVWDCVVICFGVSQVCVVAFRLVQAAEPFTSDLECDRG